MKNYKILSLFTIVFVMFCQFTSAQKTANFSYGTYGTEGYESFQLSKNKTGQPSILYGYGKNAPSKLKYLGTATINNIKTVKVQFANNYLLYVSTVGNKLKVTDNKGKYNKLFNWQYEGPVNGIGTFCTACAANEKEAIEIVNTLIKK